MNRLPPKLIAILKKHGRLAVAYSGGVDSRFLLHAAKLSGCPTVAIHARGPHIPEEESVAAIQWAKDNEIPLVELNFNPLDFAEIRKNTKERCYFCKKKLLALLGAYIQKRSDGPWTLCDGSHAGDAEGWRPGRQALAEAGIISPLAESGLNKAEIRAAAALTAMSMPNQRAKPCLLTRFAYNQEPAADILLCLGQCESEIAGILPPEADLRLRLTPEPILQLANAGEYDSSLIEKIAKKHGFAGIVIKNCAKVSGFYDME